MQKICVVRILQVKSQNIDKDGASHPTQIWAIKSEGYSEGADIDARLDAKEDSGDSMWFPQRQGILLRMFADKLGDPVREKQDEVNNIIKAVESGGTLDLAVIRLLYLAQWRLLSSHKVTYAPEVFMGTEVDGSIILGPFASHWVTEFYFESH